MHLFKNTPDGYWQCRFQLNKKLIVRSTKTHDKKLAERFAYDLRNSLLEKHHNPDKRDDISLAGAMDLYDKKVKDKPYIRCVNSYRTFVFSQLDPDFILSDLTSTVVARLVAEHSSHYAPATTKHLVGYLRCTHKHAKSLGYRTSEVEWPSVEVRNERRRYLSKVEEKKFLEALSPDRTWTKMGKLTEYQKSGMQKAYDYAIALLDTGGRTESEVLALSWPQIDLKNRTIVLMRTKTDSGTTLEMTDRLYEVLARRFKERDSEYVFGNVDGEITKSLTNRLRKALKRAGLKDVRVYDLRHTYASRLIQNGLSLFETSHVLGHKSVNTSARYAHLEKSDVAAKAAKVLNSLNRHR